MLETTNEETEETAELTLLENEAHKEKVLLSSDAMRYFITRVISIDERKRVLKELIVKARVSFPSEDGWVIINLVRMEELMEELAHIGVPTSLVATDLETSVSYEPMVAGSLAEAIVSGNSIASYELIKSRPMVALADAVSEFDAVYRSRRGQQVSISEMLKKETAKLTDEQLQSVMTALTSALDGVYTDEESAVKMAIMRAIKAIG